MHFAQSNEFVGACGAHSVIHPIGYGMVLKTTHNVGKKRLVRSAVEQFEIHSIAADFHSEALRIPKPHALINNAAYVMEFILPGGIYLPPNQYKHFPTLIHEFNRFFGYMFKSGYFPYKFSILAYPDNKYVLFDFGHFGTAQNGFIKLRHLSHPIPIMEAEHRFGILSFLIDQTPVLESEEKIETCAIEF